MKNLIVNADDFGTSHGVNLGVLEAHRKGIVTSTSLMVDQPASAEAAQLSAADPELGVGLHVVIRSGDSPAAEVERQLARFVELTGRLPTHIDSHHNVHMDGSVLPAFLSAAERHSLPLRGHCGVRHIPTFYGQWDGETHLESIGPEALVRIVADEAKDGFNELCCHPGYADGDLVSSYVRERETELETLCDPQVATLLRDREVHLVTFREVPTP
jgi:chitin disaccharide deacetylase